jgi:hypothetical protein
MALEAPLAGVKLNCCAGSDGLQGAVMRAVPSTAGQTAAARHREALREMEWVEGV